MGTAMTAPAAGAPPTAEEVQPALDRSVANTLFPLTLALAFLFGFFAVTDLWAMDAAQAVVIAGLDLAVAAVLLAGAVAVRRWPPPDRYANAAVAGIAGLVAAFGAAVMRVRPEPIESVVFLMLVLGAGVVLLSYRWLAAVAATSIAVWAWAALHAAPSEDWVQYGQALFTAALLSFIVLHVRRRALERAERLRIGEERLRHTLEDAQRVAHIGNWAWDIRTGQVAWSDELYRLFGLAPGSADVDYDGFLARVHPEDRAMVAARIEQTLRTGHPFEFDHRIVDAQGTTRWLHARGFVVAGPDGQPARMVGTAQDIQDRKRAEREERDARLRLEEIEHLRRQDAFKTQFINEVAHELNTPLTPIQVQLELMKLLPNQGLTPEHAQSLQIIERNVNRFGALISDVLDAARLQGRNLGLRREDFDLARLVRESAESFGPSARRAHIELDVDAPPEVVVNGDAGRIAQVLDNLLTNAIKYSPGGGRIDVSVAADDDRATVSVRDSGIGVRAEDIPRLFQPFTQTHDVRTVKAKGTGLGLYVSRGIIELHHGRIWCESPGAGQGSTFAFAIPRTAHVPKVAAASRQAAAAGIVVPAP